MIRLLLLCAFIAAGPAGVFATGPAGAAEASSPVTAGKLPAADSHRSSITYVQRVPQTGMLEISLQADAADFAAALSRRAGQEVTLDDSAASREAALAYLREVIQVAPPRSEPLPLDLVALIVDRQMVSVYLRTVSVPRLEGLVLRHALFTELHENQSNLVIFRDGDFRARATFDARQPVRPVARGI